MVAVAAPKLVVIDPGHGGRDPGASGHGLEEKVLTLAISQRVAAALTRDYEVRVELTRAGDEFVDLYERAAFANARGAAAFISIHINSAASAAARGFETYRHTAVSSGEPAARLQSIVHGAVLDVLRPHGVVNRGEKTANYAVLRLTNMPAVLTENLFITNSGDAALLASDRVLGEIAEAHAIGIARALTLPPRNVEDIHRVTADGKRIGAFRDDERVGRVVVDLIRAGAKYIVIEEIVPLQTR